jgi:hypothetical protein
MKRINMKAKIMNKTFRHKVLITKHFPVFAFFIIILALFLTGCYSFTEAQSQSILNYISKFHSG